MRRLDRQPDPYPFRHPQFRLQTKHRRHSGVNSVILTSDLEPGRRNNAEFLSAKGWDRRCIPPSRRCF